MVTSKMKERLKEHPAIVFLYDKYVSKIWDAIMRQKMFHYGELNKDKKLFLIDIKTDGKMGLYSLMLTTILPCIDFALQRGWYPVIDLRGSYLPILQNMGEMETENAWEYYYEQPSENITLEEIYQSKYVIRAWYWRNKMDGPGWVSYFPQVVKGCKEHGVENKSEQEFSGRVKDSEYWNRLIVSHIKLNKKMADRFAVEYGKIFQSGIKTLGVGIRAGLRAGAMQNDALYNDHPIQPTCEELMDIVEDKMRQWECERLFVSCDDRECLTKFIKRFGRKCQYMERKRIHYFENGKPIEELEKRLIEREGSSVRECTEEYVIETHLLAQCDCFYTCMGGAAEFAYLLNGGRFEHADLYNQGAYAGIGKEHSQEYFK